jgi:hypothetical protein
VDIDAVATLAESFRKAKTPCICREASQGEYGYLISRFDESLDQYLARCYVPFFQDDGQLETVAACDDYAVLGK